MGGSSSKFGLPRTCACISLTSCERTVNVNNVQQKEEVNKRALRSLADNGINGT